MTRARFSKRPAERRSPIPAASILVCLASLVLAGCTTFGPPPPGPAYQADLRIEVTEADGQTRPVEFVTEYYAYGLRRRQATIAGEDRIVIDRPDLQVTWVLAPEAKTFVEHRMRSEAAAHPAIPDPFGPRLRTRFTREVEESIGGVPAMRFNVEGDSISGRAWLAPDGVPLRFEGSLGVGAGALQVRIDYGEIQRTLQARYLFVIPPNYAGYETRKRPPKEEEDRGVEDAVQKLRDRRKSLPSPPIGW